MSDSGPPIRLFTYAASLSAQTARQLYDGARGALIHRRLRGANVAQAHGLVHLGCWAHARCRFVEAEAALPKAARTPEQPATQFIAAIGELYAIEATARELEVEQRLRWRQERSRAVLARLQTLLLARLHDVRPGSLLGQALYYLSEQWPKLARFVDDGRFPIDNNACVNAIRPFVVGRRNWLFAVPRSLLLQHPENAHNHLQPVPD